MQNMPEEELMEKEVALAAEVERLLPEFVNSCRDKADGVIIHQDAFAADYQDHGMTQTSRRKMPSHKCLRRCERVHRDSANPTA